MTHDANITVINVRVQNAGGQLYASSDDIFGLNITATNEPDLCDRLKAGVKWLFKQNKNVDVEVSIASEPSDFPHHVQPRNCSRLVVATA